MFSVEIVAVSASRSVNIVCIDFRYNKLSISVSWDISNDKNSLLKLDLDLIRLTERDDFFLFFFCRGCVFDGKF